MFPLVQLNISPWLTCCDFTFFDQLLWSEDLCVNTVHVDDVCKAVWHLCNHGQHGQIYNLADNGRTSKYIRRIFYENLKLILDFFYENFKLILDLQFRLDRIFMRILS